MTEEEIESARKGIREAVSEAQAELGIDIDDEPVPDGGEE
jgi:hypothetical protein